MNYNDLMQICKRNNLLQKDLADAIEMTPNGLKRAIEAGSLPINKVLPLCNFLSISVSQFFGVQNTPVEQYYNSQVQHSSGNKSRNVQIGDTKATEALVQQIQEKDRQIAKLLDLLSK